MLWWGGAIALGMVSYIYIEDPPRDGPFPFWPGWWWWSSFRSSSWYGMHESTHGTWGIYETNMLKDTTNTNDLIHWRVGHRSITFCQRHWFSYTKSSPVLLNAPMTCCGDSDYLIHDNIRKLSATCEPFLISNNRGVRIPVGHLTRWQRIIWLYGTVP